MSDDSNEFQTMSRKVNEIHRALVGSEEFGEHGIIKRLEVVEQKVESHDRKMMIFVVCGTALIFVFQIGMQVWKNMKG